MIRRRPAARVVAVVTWLSVCVVGAACGSGNDDVTATIGRSPSVVAGGSTTTLAPGDPGATTTVVDDVPTTVPGGDEPATTTPGPVVTAPPVTAPPGPVALTPPAPGLYRYSTSGATTVSGAPFPIAPIPFPAVTTNVVDSAAGPRQHSRRNLQDPAGNGSVADYIFEYRGDGVYLVSLTFTTTFSGQTSTQSLVPPAPLLFLATGAGTGASRTLDIPVGGSAPARVVVDVLGSEAVNVAGASVDTLIVRSTATLPPGAVTGTQSLVINLDRATRLWVRERGVGDGTASASGLTLTIHTQYDAVIQSINPS